MLGALFHVAIPVGKGVSTGMPFGETFPWPPRYARGILQILVFEEVSKSQPRFPSFPLLLPHSC